jgi:hypothetical protein
LGLCRNEKAVCREALEGDNKEDPLLLVLACVPNVDENIPARLCGDLASMTNLLLKVVSLTAEAMVSEIEGTTRDEDDNGLNEGEVILIHGPPADETDETDAAAADDDDDIQDKGEVVDVIVIVDEVVGMSFNAEAAFDIDDDDNDDDDGDDDGEFGLDEEEDRNCGDDGDDSKQ